MKNRIAMHTVLHITILPLSMWISKYSKIHLDFFKKVQRQTEFCILFPDYIII